MTGCDCDPEEPQLLDSKATSWHEAKASMQSGLCMGAVEVQAECVLILKGGIAGLSALPFAAPAL